LHNRNNWVVLGIVKAARLDNATEAEHRRLAAVNVLIIDDLALQPLDETTTADFYELIVAQSAIDRLASTSHEPVLPAGDGSPGRETVRRMVGRDPARTYPLGFTEVSAPQEEDHPRPGRGRCR
jgi:hypothetical protein